MPKDDQKDKKKHPRAGHIANLVDRDWGSLFEQLSGVIDWALDIAAKFREDHSPSVRFCHRSEGLKRLGLGFGEVTPSERRMRTLMPSAALWSGNAPALVTEMVFPDFELSFFASRQGLPTNWTTRRPLPPALWHDRRGRDILGRLARKRRHRMAASANSE